MIEAAGNFWNAIPWTWVGISGLCVVLAAAAVWLGRIESAIWFAVAALCTGYVGSLHGRLDYAEAQLAAAAKAVSAAEADRERWRKAAADLGSKTQEWEAAARAARARAAAAEKASATRARALEDEIAALEAALAARGVIPLPVAFEDSRRATDALP